MKKMKDQFEAMNENIAEITKKNMDDLKITLLKKMQTTEGAIN